MRRLWRSDGGDVYSAESAEEAKRLRDEWSGFEPDSDDALGDPFDEPIPDETELKVGLETEADIDTCFPWARTEPEASIQPGTMHTWAVVAPARVFAKHETGMVCSENY
jgi:hypothetical protein